jgi:hypothetical protein
LATNFALSLLSTTGTNLFLLFSSPKYEKAFGIFPFGKHSLMVVVLWFDAHMEHHTSLLNGIFTMM